MTVRYKLKESRVPKRSKIRARIRSKISGTKKRPRLSVFRSNKYIYVQIIDDVAGHTLCAASVLDIKSKKGTKVDQAYELGKLIAEKSLKINKNKVVFDRGGYKYHGRVRALAEGAREGGLQF